MPNEQISNDANEITAQVITRLVAMVEATKDEFKASEQRNTKDRAEFKQSIENSIDGIRKVNQENIVQLRKDFNRALQPLMLETLDSRESRKTIQQALDNDGLVRKERQAQIDRQFTILTIMVVIITVLILVAFIIIIVRLLIMSRN